MKNRSFFIFLVILCVIVPGIHYFIAGKNSEHELLRNLLVLAQIVGGIMLIVLYGLKRTK